MANHTNSSHPRSGQLVGGLWIALAIVGIVLVGLVSLDWWTSQPVDVQASFVGGDRCADCHEQQTRLWRGSHHDLAMDVATNDTILGDFSGTTIKHYGITSRMYKVGDRFMVYTEGPDGEMAEFEVKYVFGVEPLQQYMVELEQPTGNDPDAIGRVQVLRISWDTQRNRWFYLSPPDVDEKLAPDDPLHWTGAAQNWNHMCATCHSTNLVKGFDIAALAYHTTYSDIDVNCEACHGPGSLHSDLAGSFSLFWDRNHGYGLTRMKREGPEVQISSCAPCHSRRTQFKAGYTCGANYFDHFSNELMRQATYYPDGQVLDEVYVYGSFIQSKMYAKDVRCTDCHDPHSTRVKFTDNRLCTTCHQRQHDPAKYDTPAHHHHTVGSTGASCIACHMLDMPFMDIDLRRDHSFQVPRPDVSVRLKTPNACTACHLDKARISDSKRDGLVYYADWLQAARDGDEEIAAELTRLDAWAAKHTKLWFGDAPANPPRVEFADTFHRAWNHDAAVVPELAKLARNRQASGMVRGTAVNELQNFPLNETGLAAIRAATKDRDPIVRAAAARVFATLPAPHRVTDIGPLLEDPIRHVRIQAALTLVEASTSTFSDKRLNAMKTALRDYRQSLLENSDLASAHVALGVLAERQGDLQSAESAYRNAMRVQPLVTGPRSNLATLLEQLHKPEEAIRLRRDEMDLMIRDSNLAPNDPSIQYRLGLNLYLNDRWEEAAVSLARAVELDPGNERFVMTLALLYQKQEKWDDAIMTTKQLLKLAPANASYHQLLRDMEQQKKKDG